MAREIIFGVYDKFGECGSYTGYFKHEEDAKKEFSSIFKSKTGNEF